MFIKATCFRLRQVDISPSNTYFESDDGNMHADEPKAFCVEML